MVWRYSGNPIVKRDQIPGSNSIFNSAVKHKDGKFAGIMRSDNTAMEQHLFLAKSDDAIHWDIEPSPLASFDKDGNQTGVACGYDPRVCYIDDRYYVTWRNQYHGPTIGIAYSFDFKHFVQLENAFFLLTATGVLFP